MVTRVRKNVPLHEKFGLFTEAPKKKKKRVINIRSPRTRDYAEIIMQNDDTILNNISPDEDPLSGEIGELDFTDDGAEPDAPERDLEGELDNELQSIQREPGYGNDITSGDGEEPESSGEGSLEGDDVQPSGEGDAEQVTNPEGTTGSSTDDGEESDRSTAPGDTADAGDESELPGDGGEDGTGDVPTEPQDNEGETTTSDTAGGNDPSGDAGGDQQLQTSTEPAGTTGDAGDGGAAGSPGEDTADSDGTGDVDETIEIDDPSEEDDFIADTEDPSINSDTGGEEVPPTTDTTTSDPNATPTDPNVAVDPNADPNAADPTAGVNADMEEFDKNDMRKFQLFKRFIDLHDVSVHFVSVLEAIISDDADYGMIISNVTKKLKRVEGILKDYMILKFQSDSYLQNSFFFEKAKTTILLSLEMLKQGKKRNDTTKH